MYHELIQKIIKREKVLTYLNTNYLIYKFKDPKSTVGLFLINGIDND